MPITSACHSPKLNGCADAMSALVYTRWYSVAQLHTRVLPRLPVLSSSGDTMMLTAALSGEQRSAAPGLYRELPRAEAPRDHFLWSLVLLLYVVVLNLYQTKHISQPPPLSDLELLGAPPWSCPWALLSVVQETVEPAGSTAPLGQPLVDTPVPWSPFQYLAVPAASPSPGMQPARLPRRHWPSRLTSSAYLVSNNGHPASVPPAPALITHASDGRYPSGRPTQRPPSVVLHGPLATVNAPRTTDVPPRKLAGSCVGDHRTGW
jgi:hypothetical protein